MQCARVERAFGAAAGRRTLRAAPWALLVAVAASALHGGCASPTAPPPPPGGGETPVLSFEHYEQNVAPVLSRHGCDAEGDCHGGGIRGSLELSPPGAKDLAFDFAQVSLQVSVSLPESSPILTEPLALAAGGTPHQIKPFSDTGDPDYQAILAWVIEGTSP